MCGSSSFHIPWGVLSWRGQLGVSGSGKPTGRPLGTIDKKKTATQKGKCLDEHLMQCTRGVDSIVRCVVATISQPPYSAPTSSHCSAAYHMRPAQAVLSSNPRWDISNATKLPQMLGTRVSSATPTRWTGLTQFAGTSASGYSTSTSTVAHSKHTAQIPRVTGWIRKLQ